MGFISASNADVLTTCSVSRFRIEDGRLTGLETSRGTVDTQAAVIAAGPLSAVLAKQAEVELPIETVVRQKVVMPVVPEVPAVHR
jgi:glycine/D-amino acid oxidase-like deaminating enzyme